MSSQTVTVRKVLAASCEEVFDAAGRRRNARVDDSGAVTNGEVVLDSRRRFRIVMKEPHAHYVNTGEFLVLDRPAKLQFTWASSRWSNQETLVTVELNRCDERCELVLIHERFPVQHSGEQLVKGWTRILEKLADQWPSPQ